MVFELILQETSTTKTALVMITKPHKEEEKWVEYQGRQKEPV